MQRNRRVWVILRGILKHIMEELATSQFPCICKTSLYNRHLLVLFTMCLLVPSKKNSLFFQSVLGILMTECLQNDFSKTRKKRRRIAKHNFWLKRNSLCRKNSCHTSLYSLFCYFHEKGTSSGHYQLSPSTQTGAHNKHYSGYPEDIFQHGCSGTLVMSNSL